MHVPNRRPQLELVTPTASPEEAAAVIAAVEQFLRDHAPPAGARGRAGCRAGSPRRAWSRSSARPTCIASLIGALQSK